MFYDEIRKPQQKGKKQFRQKHISNLDYFNIGATPRTGTGDRESLIKIYCATKDSEKSAAEN